MQYPRVIQVSNAPEGAWVMGVSHEGIMGAEFTVGLPRGPMGRRCMWLVVFASSAVRQRLLSPACHQLEGWSM